MTGLGYNTRLFKEKGWAAPTSWMDLADPKFKGKVVFQSASGSTFGLHGFLMFSFLGLALTGMIVAVKAQAPVSPRFDIVSVKRNTSNAEASSLRPEPNGITAVNILPVRLVRVAYQVADFQIVDMPGWFTSERYDVTARTAEPVSIDQIGTMLKTLLAERFGLRITQQRRDSPVLELRIESSCFSTKV